MVKPADFEKSAADNVTPQKKKGRHRKGGTDGVSMNNGFFLGKMPRATKTAQLNTP